VPLQHYCQTDLNQLEGAVRGTMPLDPQKTKALDKLFYDLFNGAVGSDALLYSLAVVPRQRKALASTGSGWILLDEVEEYLTSARYALKPDGSVNRDMVETADVDAKNLEAQTAKRKADTLNAEVDKAQKAAAEAREAGNAAAADEADQIVAAKKPDADLATAAANELIAIADEAREAKQAREAQDHEAVTKVQALHRGNRARKAAKKGADALRAYAATLFPPPPVVEEEEDFDPAVPEHNRDIKVTGGSLFLFPETASWRHGLNRFLNGKVVDTFLLFCILTNVFVLAIETPTSVWRPAFVDLFYTIDNTLSIVFSVEMVLRIVSLGFIMSPTAYLRTSWNILDFVVVTSIWVTWVVGYYDAELAESANISYLRTARALRPLRSLRFFTGIKMIMTSLFEAIPMVISVVVLIGFFFLLFAAVGLSLYQGALTRECIHTNHTVAIANNLTEIQAFNGTSRDGVSTIFYDGEYVDYVACPKTMQCDGDDVGHCHVVKYSYTGDLPDEIYSYGFDNFRNAIMTVFIVSTLDEWPQIADPIRSAPLMADWTVWGFFASIVFICSLLGASLFVAVISFAFAHVVNEDGESAFASGEVYEVAEKEPTGAVALAKARQNSMEFDNPLADNPAEPIQVGANKENKQALGEMFEQEANASPKKPGVKALRDVVETSQFEMFILLIVVLNTCALAAEHYDPQYHDNGGMSPEFRDTLHIFELIFTTIYVVELLMKQVGLGPREYFSSGFNCLDFTLVVTTVLSWQLKDLKGFGAGRILRLFRAARLIRLLKQFTAVRKLLRTVTKSWSSLLNVVFFITVWLVIFAVMGIHLYGFDTPTFDVDGLPRDNFHNFGRSFLTCYILLTGEDWSPLMFKYVKAFGWGSAIYFVCVVIMTKFVLINMFVAVILENFTTPDNEKLEIQKKKYEEDLARRMGSGIPKKSVVKVEGDCPHKGRTGTVVEGNANETIVLFDEQEETALATDLLEVVEKPDELVGLALTCSNIVNNSLFETLIIAVIIISSICLGIEGPPDAEYLQDYEAVRLVLAILDIVFFLIFWAECVLKIISMGFATYWSDGWNKLDFSVVMLSTVDVLLRMCDSCGSYAWVKVFRVARVMRPLRVARRFDNIRIIVDGLISALGGVAAVAALAIFIYMVFAVIGLNVFAGKFWTCQEEGFEGLDMAECKAANLTWANPDQHFDSIGDAMETLFVTATLEGWVEIMNRGMDMPEDIGMAPVEGNYWGASIFFVLFTVLASFAVTNLFIGVLVNNFQESTGSAVMTDEQQEWARFQMLLAVVSVEKSDKLIAAEMASASPLQRKLLPIVNAPGFEIAGSLCIFTNCLVLLSESFPQSESYSEFVQLANFLFLVLFTIEAGLQIVARGPVVYIQSNWFKLDIIVISLSWVLTVLDIQAGQNAARLIRMLRVLLILKFAKMARSMILTVILSLPPACNVILVQILVLYVYGVAGMQLYGNLEECDKINDNQNFRNIFTSMMYLFQISTGQDFKSIMFDIRAQDGQFVAPFFVSFYTVSIYVFINLFVAVLLEAFEREFDDSITLDIAAEDMVEFKNQWDGKCQQMMEDGLVDPEGKKCGLKKPKNSVPLRCLREFISSLPEDSELGYAREVGRGKTLDSIKNPAKIIDAVWWNRLLHELTVNERCVLYNIEEAFIHEVEQGQHKTSDILDQHINFDEVVVALQLMRSQAIAKRDGKVVNILNQLTYQERVEMQAELDRKQTAAAYGMLRASVGAWKAFRNPPADIAEKIANDPSGKERQIWNMQVRRLTGLHWLACLPLSYRGACHEHSTCCGGCLDVCIVWSLWTVVSHGVCFACPQVTIGRTLMMATVINRQKVV